MTNQLIAVASKALCVGMMVFQGLLLNAYLSKLYNPNWWSWVIADVAVMIIWVVCIRHANKSFAKKQKGDDSADQERPNEIKYTYIAWLVYISLLVPRIGLVFHDLAKTLDEQELLGPNFLKMAVSCTPIIYFLLVNGSHSNESGVPRHLSVQGIATLGALDLFDSIELLEFLFLPEEGVTCPKGYLTASLIFACISMFLPVLSLYALRFKMKPGRVSSLTFKISYELLNFSLINFPNLVIRSVLWHKFQMDVSVLLMKNVMGIILGGYEMFEYFTEFRPIACKKCNDWFERSAYGKHKAVCSTEDTMPLTPIAAET